MALKKSFTFPSGFTAEYFRLNEVRYNKTRGSFYAEFELWKDAATRAAAKSGQPATCWKTDGARVMFESAAKWAQVFPSGLFSEADLYEAIKGGVVEVDLSIGSDQPNTPLEQRKMYGAIDA